MLSFVRVLLYAIVCVGLSFAERFVFAIRQDSSDILSPGGSAFSQPSTSAGPVSLSAAVRDGASSTQVNQALLVTTTISFWENSPSATSAIVSDLVTSRSLSAFTTSSGTSRSPLLARRVLHRLMVRSDGINEYS